MKKLIIVRHAKSSWDLPVADYDRSLLERGVQRAKEHAKLLEENLGFMPQYWVSSYAIRALHTAVIFSDYFNRVNDLHIQKELYTFSAGDLLNQIYKLPQEHDSVILFSHNDACHEVVKQLTSEDIAAFKTASVAVMEFKQSHWNQISDGILKILISKGHINHGK